MVALCFLFLTCDVRLAAQDQIENLGLQFSLFYYSRKTLCTIKAGSLFAESDICPNVILCLSFQVSFEQMRFLRLERAVHN